MRIEMKAPRKPVKPKEPQRKTTKQVNESVPVDFDVPDSRDIKK